MTQIKTIVLLLLLIPICGMAQKIKTKKDRVLIDETEVAILNDKIRDTYELFDLKNQKQLVVEYKTLMEGQTIINQWLKVSLPDGSKSSEIPYDVLITSFSPTKIILHLLSAKYELFDSKGINTDKIAAFFSVKRDNIGDNATKAKTELILNRKEKQDKISKYRPFVKTDGTVMLGGTLGTNIVGKVIGSPSNFGLKSTASVYDLDGILVATADISNNMDNKVDVTLFNENKFDYKAEKRYSGLDNSSFFTELIGELLYRDYALGHQAKAYKEQLYKEKVKLAKERSQNVYNKNGYAIDEKGIKYEGILTAQFEMLDVNQTGNNQVVDAIDNYGKNVTIKYINDKGKERTITLAAKNGTSFFIKNTDGSETAYYGMKVKGDAMKKISNAMSLGFNNAYFYKLLYTSQGNHLLVDPIEGERFVIKLKDKDSGQMIDKRNNQNLSAELSEYLNACKSLSNEIKAAAFDLKIQENLKNIIDEFNTCK